MNNEPVGNFTQYDFDRPDKFSFENLKSIDSILSVFSRDFATELSGLLRIPAEVNVRKVEQVPFNSEYTEKREKDQHVFIVTNLKDKEQILIQLDVGFLLCVHSKNGGGSFGTIRDVKKNITEIEKLTAQYLVSHYVYPPLQKAFNSIFNSQFTVDRIDTDPQYAKITLPQDMVALATLDVRLGTEVTSIQVLIPYLSIEHFIERFNTDNVLKNRKSVISLEQQAYLKEHLLMTKEDFSVELGVTQVTLAEFMSLEKGDTLLLNLIEEPVLCYIGDKPKFLGKIGVNEGKYAVKIVGLADNKKIIEAKEKATFKEE